MTKFPEAYVMPGLETVDEAAGGKVEEDVLVSLTDEETEVKVVAAELETAAELLAAIVDEVMEVYPIRNAPQ